MGSRTIRIFIGTLDIQRVYDVNPPGATDLVCSRRVLLTISFFGNPQFQTYLLTAYFGSTQANWSMVTGFEYATERHEIKRLGDPLHNTAFAGKTFIILNWGGQRAPRPLQQALGVGFLHPVDSRARRRCEVGEAKFPSSGAHLFSG